MAGDDNREDDFDPWAELESTPSPDLEGGFDFSFDEQAKGDETPADTSPVPEEPAETPAFFAEAVNSTGDDSAADESVSDWLTEAEETADEPAPLGVFAGDDEPAAVDADDPESVRVGTEESGIVDEADLSAASAGPADAGADQDDVGFGWDEVDGESVEDPVGEPVPFGVVGSDVDDHGVEATGFGGATEGAEPVEDWGDLDGESVADPTDAAGEAVAAVAVAGAATGRKPAGRRARKGGLGQLLGIVLGGLLALPITFAILIWGFRQDPLKLVRHMPESLAFLFPEELVRGGKPARDGGAGGPTLDDVPSIAGDGAEGTGTPPDAVDVAVTEPVAEPVAEPAAVAVTEPVSGADPPMATDEGRTEGGPAAEPPVADTDTVATVSPVEPQEPMTDPLAATPPGVPGEAVAATEPAIDATPAAPAPAPLDLTALDAAVASAGEALQAIRSVESAEGDVDPDAIRRERVRNRLLVDWYRRLSVVAEEVAGLERIAADTGRPLTGPPESLAALQADVVDDPGRLTDLSRLARNWMAYQGRSTSGVVMPAELGGIRRIGPYWCSTVTVAEAGDSRRDVVVLSRSEPAAAIGDVVLVTGLIVDGDTVWASDLRSASDVRAAVPADEPPAMTPDKTQAVDPFAEPATDGEPIPGSASQPGGEPSTIDPFATPAP